MPLPTCEKGTYQNASASSYRCGLTAYNQVKEFHQGLVGYSVTKLWHFPQLISGVRHLYIKDESNRFGLPAFKILGASYAIHQTLAKRLGLPPNSAAADIAILAQAAGFRVLTASAGNWGRAVARTASSYGLPATVYVPAYTSEATRQLIAGESIDHAENITCIPMSSAKGTYDDCLTHIRCEANKDPEKVLFVMDTSWDGYSEFPGLVTDGYLTMLREVSEQLSGLSKGGYSEPTHVVLSVGVGSWAHACVAYYSSFPEGAKRPVLIAVEPEDAACLLTSLHANSSIRVQTRETIMAGMNCGEVSSIAWPVLAAGIDVAVSVSDSESHEVVVELTKLGLSVGPCGAATLAGLRKLHREGTVELAADSCVVLFSTEGARKYDYPTQ